MKTANSLSKRHKAISKATTSERSTFGAHNLKRMEYQISRGVTVGSDVNERELTNQNILGGEKLEFVSQRR